MKKLYSDAAAILIQNSLQYARRMVMDHNHNYRNCDLEAIKKICVKLAKHKLFNSSMFIMQPQETPVRSLIHQITAFALRIDVDAVVNAIVEELKQDQRNTGCVVWFYPHMFYLTYDNLGRVAVTARFGKQALYAR
jgi:hypothetical protein